MAAFSGVALVSIAAATWVGLRLAKGNPEKRERKRRWHVNRYGRLGDAFITEAAGDSLYYEYSIHGVEYSASQDISALRERLPAQAGSLIGLASLKYDPRNPANSILICEEWSGLRVPRQSTSLQS